MIITNIIIVFGYPNTENFIINFPDMTQPSLRKAKIWES